MATETIERPDLKTAITAAVAAADKEHNTTPPVEEKVEHKVEVKEEVKEKTQEEKDAEALDDKNARELYKALKDPSTRDSVIELIASKAGYTKPETKAEVKEAKKGMAELLKSALGEEFEFLSSKLAPALETYLNDKLEETQKDIREKLAETEKEKLQDQSSRAMSKLTTEFFGQDVELPDVVKDGMSKYMDRVPPHPDHSMMDYLSDAFYATIGKLGLTKAVKSSESKTKKIEANRNDAPARLASERTSSRVGDPVEDKSKTMSRRQAIEDAIRQADKEMK